MDNSLKDSESFYHFFTPFTTTKALVYLIIIGILIYFTMLFNGFVWDDYTYVVNNTDIHTLNIYQLFGAGTFNSAGYYRPMTAVYFAVIYKLFTLQPFYYHAMQLVVHIANTCLLFYVFKRFFTTIQSFMLALLFLIHPIQVESVAFISASLSELFFFFGISALLIAQKKLTGLTLGAISILLLLSILSKETGILFYLVVFLDRILFNRKKIKILAAGLAASFGIYLFIRFVLAKIAVSTDVYVPLTHLTLSQRLISIPAIVFYYIKTLFYPVNLAIDQLWYVSSVDLAHFYIPLCFDLLFFLLLGLLGMYAYQKNKRAFAVYLFFLGWFCMGLIMLLQIYPIDLTVSDRWMYFPLVGLLGLIGQGITNLSFINRKNNRIFICLFVLICVLFSLRTMIRISNWRDDLTINSHDAAVVTNFDLENNLGVDYLASGQCQLAKIHFAKSVSLSPNDVNVDNLGLADACLKHMTNAKKAYIRAISEPGYLVGPNHKHFLALYINVINFFVLNDNPHTGIQYIDLALEDYPNTSILYHYLAAAQYKIGFKKEARLTEKKADILPATPGYVDVYRLVTNPHG